MSGVALIGAGWISSQYAAALGQIPNTRLAAVASRTLASAERFAAEHGARTAVDFGNLETIWKDPDVAVVCVNSPNHLHASHVVAALGAGKHVIVEKPLCLTLAEADEMAAAADDAGRTVAYAENLVFVPHYTRARELIRSGALGKITGARQCEKHAGPYSPWFFDPLSAGGGALCDMGCHGIELLRWLFDRPATVAVRAKLATLAHAERTSMDDEAWLELEFADGLRVVSESSWALQGGMQSTLEVQGSEGTLHVDLLGETGMGLYTKDAGWTRPVAEPLRLNGYVQELEHFFDVFRRGAVPDASLADGRAVLEILFAAYASASSDARVTLPFDPGDAASPVALWRR